MKPIGGAFRAGISIALVALGYFSQSPEIPARTAPALSELLAASEYLDSGDIPEDTSTTSGKTPLYVDTGGDDGNTGLDINAPKRSLGSALAYANSHPSTPYVIYLRGGTYYRESLYEYQEIERGDIYITAYPGEEVVIRPDFWPNDPTSWGQEVLFHSSGPHQNITIGNLGLQGWSIPFIFGSPFEEAPMRNLTIKNIRATDFKERAPDFITSFFSTEYVLEGYFAESEFDPADPGIKYQIENLILSGIDAEGVEMPVNIGDEDDANVKGVRISRFEARNPPQEGGSTAVDGFAVVNCENVLIDTCVINNIEGDGIDTKSYDVCVANTLVHAVGRNAVKFWHNGELINSVIYEADADAALVYDAGPGRIINSLLMKKGDGYSATFAYDSGAAEELEVMNSIFSDLDHSFYVGTPNFSSRNSLYFDMPGGIYSGSVTASNAAQLNALSGCSGNLSADPLLADPPEEEFSPAAGSPAIDAGTGTGVLLPSFDYFGNSRVRGDAPDIGPVETSPRLVMGRGDYDGDGSSDVAVFRGGSGSWSVRNLTRVYFGGEDDLPAPADYDGDGTAEIAVFRKSDGRWAVRNLSRFYFGGPLDQPVPGDYNGEGRAEAGIFRATAGIWSIRNLTRVYFGGSGDQPVPGDYDGDGGADIGAFRGSGGRWAVRSLTRFFFGTSGDDPATVDYAGDGPGKAAIFRPSSALWSIRGATSFYFGASADQAVPGDYDGNGADEAGIFRDSAGLWAVRNLTRLYYGAAGDVPVTR